MEKKYNINDIVEIIVDTPSGSSKKVKGNIGIITSIELEEDGYNYQILCDHNCWYWYLDSEFTYATEDKIKEKLVSVLQSFSKYN